jgi:hypothetical protein
MLFLWGDVRIERIVMRTSDRILVRLLYSIPTVHFTVQALAHTTEKKGSPSYDVRTYVRISRVGKFQVPFVTGTVNQILHQVKHRTEIKPRVTSMLVGVDIDAMADDVPPPPRADHPNGKNGDAALHDAIRDKLHLAAIRSTVDRATRHCFQGDPNDRGTCPCPRPLARRVPPPVTRYPLEEVARGSPRMAPKSIRWTSRRTWRAGKKTTAALEEFLAAKVRHCEGDDDEPAEIAVRVPRARRDNARTLELVQILVEESSGSVPHKNGKGMTPLLVAAENDAPLDVLLFLATAWPEAIYGSRRRGGSRH